VISPEAMEALKGYSWPGNVRELKNMVERLVIMTPEQRSPLIISPIRSLQGSRCGKRAPGV